MTLTIVNHCHDGKKRQHRTFITIGKPNGVEDVLKAHGYHANPLLFFYDDKRLDAPGGLSNGEPSTPAPSQVIPIPDSEVEGPSGFFGKDLVIRE
jgi:hypothetical protein